MHAPGTNTTERRASCRARAPGLVLWWWSSRVRCDIDAPRNIYSISWPRRARCGADEREADARNRGVSGNKTCVAPGERSGSRPDLMPHPMPAPRGRKGRVGGRWERVNAMRSLWVVALGEAPLEKLWPAVARPKKKEKSLSPRLQHISPVASPGTRPAKLDIWKIGSLCLADKSPCTRTA